MANHASSIKRIRSNETRRLLNRYQAKTTRNAVRDLRALTNKEEAIAALPKVKSMLDKLAKKNVIHKNKAGNLISKLTKHVVALAK
jgi:small subunit ribosomal protein S20